MLNTSYPRAIRIWLFAGVAMVFFQIVIGGITRLTGSGLSITKWEIITGTIPPMNANQWEEAFDLYKATPQYQKINEGMTMASFKIIYFWEYLHRLWARSMGFVFLFPFLFFLVKGWIDRPLLRHLVVVIVLAAIVASFGWIMVASGLIDRPWVNAYKLTIHLSLGLVLFSYLLWLASRVSFRKIKVSTRTVRRWAIGLTALVGLQIIFGGLMSGMKAGLFYPTWPDMHGVVVPAVLFEGSSWTAEAFREYDKFTLMPALVQTIHRWTGYLLAIISMLFAFKLWRTSSPVLRQLGLLFVFFVGIQVVLGILTLINSVGQVPVTLGVLHQAGAIFILGLCIYLLARIRPGSA